MSSTKFNVGLTDDRSSSRVLRPPGGGHTDIFGAEPLPVKKDNGRNASSIMEGTNCVPTSPAKPAATPSPVTFNAPDSTAPAAASQRSRVPPGGFSSGLW